MPDFAACPRPVTSPWGAPQMVRQPIPGVWSIDTASHGGFLLSEQRQAAMPPSLAIAGGAYEEGCDWALVVLSFEAEFLAADPKCTAWIRLAHDSAKVWHAGAYSGFTGIPVAPVDNHVLRRRAAYLERIGEVCVTAAFGSWADWVLAGKVGVVGRVIAGVDHLGNASYEGEEVRGLCDEAAYDARPEAASFTELGVEPCADRIPVAD